MKQQREYWENRIVLWEEVSYGTAEAVPAPFVERVANLFRGPVRNRARIAFEVVITIKPKHVLDLGCGSGSFAISLVTEANVCHVTGVDISSTAIKVAQERAASMDLSDRLTFICSAVSDLDFKALQPFDFVVGLGLTPYLTEAEFNYLFSSIKDTAFWFDIHPKSFDLNNLAHFVYRKIKGHPFYVQYTRREILAKLLRLGVSDVVYRQSRGVSYIMRGVHDSP